MAIFEDATIVLFIPYSEAPVGIRNLGDSITMLFPTDQYESGRQQILERRIMPDGTLGGYEPVDPKHLALNESGSTVGYIGFGSVIWVQNVPEGGYLITRTRNAGSGYPGFGIEGFTRQELKDLYNPT